MALFVVRHQHAAEHCPAQDPFMGATLLTHISRSHARERGIDIKGEAVVDGGHTVFMIVEAPDLPRVHEFMEPFAAVGSLDVYPASTCTRVVARGGCAAGAPQTPEGIDALDPEDACQDAIEAGLIVHRAHPLNCETSIAALVGGTVMPNARFYVRNHFHAPRLDPSTWRLEVTGLVDHALSLDLHDLHAMRSHSLVVTLECAGNGRSLLSPPVDGEPWGLGAASTAEWTGVPLTAVLDRAGVSPSAREVLFRGADSGPVNGTEETVRFERSLSVDDAWNADVLLAYAMNGEPLPVEHGFPLRVVVPGWYAVASVKWLSEIHVTDTAFAGYFQAEKYCYEWERGGKLIREPVRLQRVRALIIEPRETSIARPGALVIRGVAWSGAGPIERVEVSVDGGTWTEARLIGEPRPHCWQWWELMTRIDRPGTAVLRARALDVAGRTQPDHAEWNRLGYGGNAVEEVRVVVGGD
jgi:DMSO/TMAO reductase YedYZ molybdopterin-dependent catalytic subunit